MSSILLKNSGVVLPEEKRENCGVMIENGIISGITSDSPEADEVIDLGGMALYPGFIDVHNHGAAGIDVNMADAGELLEIGRFLVSKGVTAWLPTLVPDTDENYLRAAAAIDSAMKDQRGQLSSQIIGVHYEGVFANQQMCGALRPRYFKAYAEGDEIAGLSRLENGIHLTTMAPEIENGIELVAKLAAEKWIVAIGHTNADRATLEAAFLNGARHVTHFFNAMTGLHHRKFGVAGWALTKNDVTFDVIADGHHVDPEILKLAIRSKSPDKVSLISDSIAPAGLGDGSYRVWGENIAVVDDKTRNKHGNIAGSVITMFDAVRNTLSLGFSPSEAASMASLNPAKLLGIDGSCGSIEKGKRADLIAIDDGLNIKMVMLGGKTAFGQP